MRKILCLAVSLLAASSVCWADSACGTATLDNYLVPGFTCSLGSLDFSNFRFRTNILPTDRFGTANFPNAIQVTPQTGATEKGFAFSNLGLTFFGFFSNRNTEISFDVTALSGAITDASLQLGTFTFVPPQGQAFAGYFDGLNSLVLTADASGTTLSKFLTYPGVSSLSVETEAAAIVTGFAGGSASIDGYTVLFSTPEAAVPEPASITLLCSGLAALGSQLCRRRRTRHI